MSADREISRSILVYLKLYQPSHPLAEKEWRMVEVSDAASPAPVEPDMRVLQGEITLFATDVEAYVYNLQSPEPSLFVVLRGDDGPDEGERHVHLATLSPYEAQDYLDSGDEQVERLLLPAGYEDWLRGFVDFHYKPQEFKKRKRDKVKISDEKFGNTPIFLRQTPPTKH